MGTFLRPTVVPFWDEEILQHLPSLDRYALNLARNFHAAEDPVHATFVKPYTCVNKFQLGSNLRAWLFTILRNTFYSGMRKQKHDVADPDGLDGATLVTQPEHDKTLAMGDFLNAFGQLSSEHRKFFHAGRGGGTLLQCRVTEDRDSGRNRQKPSQPGPCAVDRNAGSTALPIPRGDCVTLAANRKLPRDGKWSVQ